MLGQAEKPALNTGIGGERTVSNQGILMAKPRHGHAVCTLHVHPPTSPCPTLSAHAEPISQRQCQIWAERKVHWLV